MTLQYRSRKQIIVLVAIALVVGALVFLVQFLLASLAYDRGVCTALTGNETCNWSHMRPCDPDETTARINLPCVIMPRAGDAVFDHVIVYMDHVCPRMPDDVQCINTSGPEYDE